MKPRPQFFNGLQEQELPDGIRIRLLAPLHYFSPLLERITGDGHVYLETGFVCDLTSLRLGSFVSRGPWNRAAAVHDWLYFNGRHAGQRITKREADLVFHEAMKCLHTNPVRREVFYGGVLLLAWKAWLGHRRRDRKNRKANLSTTNLP